MQILQKKNCIGVCTKAVLEPPSQYKQKLHCRFWKEHTEPICTFFLLTYDVFDCVRLRPKSGET